MVATGIIDLSHPISADTQAFPGESAPSLHPAKNITDDGINSTDVCLTSHSGTHVDAPYHFRTDGTRLDNLPLELFTGPGLVVDVTGREDRSPITREDLAPWRAEFTPGTIVLVHTGWDTNYRTERYFHHPYLTGDAAQLLVDSGVRTVGIDTLSPDETPYGPYPAGDWSAHHTLLGAGGTIIENLRGLDRIDFPNPWISAFPIRLSSGDGAPVRAVAQRAS